MFKRFGLLIGLTALIGALQVPASQAEESSTATEKIASTVETITISYRTTNTSKNPLMPRIAMVAPCVLKLQNIYLRQSFGYGGVGTKATTTCSVSVSSISHETFIQKSGFWGLNTQEVFKQSVQGSSFLAQLDVGIPCTNALPTSWTGYTNGTVVYNGVVFTATAGVANISATYNCGT